MENRPAPTITPIPKAMRLMGPSTRRSVLLPVSAASAWSMGIGLRINNPIRFYRFLLTKLSFSVDSRALLHVVKVFGGTTAGAARQFGDTGKHEWPGKSASPRYNMADTCFSTADRMKAFMEMPIFVAKAATRLCISGVRRTLSEPE